MATETGMDLGLKFSRCNRTDIETAPLPCFRLLNKARICR